MRTLLKPDIRDREAKAQSVHVAKQLQPRKRPRLAPIWRALIEIGFILFLFYSNLLMGEFTRSHAPRTLGTAVADILTLANFDIGIVCAFIGYVVVEYLRGKI